MKVTMVLMLVLSSICVSGHVAPVAAESTSAEVAGIIRGPDGSGLPGARIVFRPLDGGRTSSAVAGARGVYRILGLSAGKHEVDVRLESFEPATFEVSIAAGETRVLDLSLAIATIHEIVTVVGAAPRDSLEATEARESSARDVGEALARTLGVAKLRKGGIANDLVLRGFKSQDVNVLIDGQRVYGACPNHMDPPAFHVDFAEVDRIEVGKGPFDVRNQGGLGGVVNIVTRKPERGFHAAGNVSAGSYGYVNPSATSSYATERFSVGGGFSYRVSGPYSDGSGSLFTQYANYRASALESDAFRAGTGWGGFSVSPARNHVAQFSYTRQQADHVLYPYLQMDAVYDDTDRFNFGYQISGLQSAVKSVRIQAYHTQVDHWMTDEYRTSSAGFPRVYSMGTLAGTKTTGGKIETGLGNLTLGIEAYNRYWDTSTYLGGMAYRPQASIPGVDALSAGIYADYRKPLSDRLRLDLGARLDRTRSTADPAKANTDLYYAYNSTRAISVTDVYPSASAHVVYSMPEGVEFSGGIGRSVRVPDAVERYFALRRMGSDWVGNPLLEPSRNTGLDGSIALRNRGIYVTSNFFSNWVSDYVTVRRAAKVNALPGIMNSNARSYANVDARIWGTELQLVYAVDPRVYFSSGLAYARGTQDPQPDMNIRSTNLAEVPPLNSRAGLRFDTGWVSAEIEGVFVSPQRKVDTDLREEPTAGYGLANLRLGANLRRFVLVFGLNNLFDRMFREHLSYQRDPFRSGARVYEPGRNVYVNISCRF